MIKIVSKTDLVKCINKVRNAGDKERSNDKYKQASVLVLFINDEIQRGITAAYAPVGSCLGPNTLKYLKQTVSSP